jgi:predicted  nucleic acid-binding Zn-ribbon protein
MLAERREVRKRIAGLEELLAAAVQENAMAVAARDESIEKLDGVRELQRTTEEANGKLRSQIEKMQAALESAGQRPDRAAKLEAEIARRGAELRTMKAEFEQKVLERAKLQNSREELVAKLRAVESELAAYRAQFGDLSRKARKAGGVASVEGPLVTIDQGSDHGVSVGDRYVVSRGPRYVCLVRITKVTRTLAVGEIEKESASREAPPRPGDVATPE